MRVRAPPRLLGALALAALLKLALVAGGALPFNADEAVVALMARHILQGERPVFFYGQAYLGSLDAWLAAGGFALFGQRVWVIRLAQGLLYLGTLATAWALARRIYPHSRWIARAAALLLAVPTVTATLYTTASLGGYGETLLIGNLLLLLALEIHAGRGRWFHWLAFGLLAGAGFWGFGLVLVYVIPAAGLLVSDLTGLRRPVRSGLMALAALAGVLVGAAPWIGFTLFHGLVGLRELGGVAIAGASSGSYLNDVGLHLYYFLLFGVSAIWGLRPSWEVRWLVLPLIPLVIAIGTGAAWAATRALARRDASAPGRRLLYAVALATVLGFLVSPFGADPSGRYFLALLVPGAILTAETLHRASRLTPHAPRPTLHASRFTLHTSRSTLPNTLLLSLLAFNFAGTVGSALRNPPGLTTQFDPVAQVDKRHDAALIEFLLAEGETRGYSNYWVEFPIAFLSGERLIFSARLPYHEDFRYTPRDDRYPPYTAAVAASPRAAYITTRHPALDAYLRGRFAGLGVSFVERQIGDYHVFYRLARKVTPQEIGLGELTP